MYELLNIQVKHGIQVVSARELHAYLEVKTRYSLWIGQYIRKDNKYGFCENEDFCSVVITTHQNQYGGEKELEDFALSVDMAKEVAMLTGTEKGKMARKYFIQIEKAARQLTMYYDDKFMDIIDRLDRAEKMIGLRCKQKFDYGKYIKNKMGIAKANRDYENVKMVLFAELGVAKWEDIDYSLEVIAKIDEILEVMKLDRQMTLIG